MCRAAAAAAAAIAAALSWRPAAAFGTGTASGALAPSPCLASLEACVQQAGVEEFAELHRWLLQSPLEPSRVDRAALSLAASAAQPSQLELAAFVLFRDLGLGLLARALELLLLCRGSDSACRQLLPHIEQVYGLRDALEARIVSLSPGYAPDAGTRSAVLRTGRNVRNDLDRFARAPAPGAEEGGASGLLTRIAELAHLVGRRTRMLSHMLGMHAWVRTLRVPGRGAPVFVLHDEYTSWLDMVESLVGVMVRNGQKALTFVEVGISAEPFQHTLLQEFSGLQYIGLALDPGSADATAAAVQQRRHQLFQEAQARTQAFAVAGRSVVHFATSGALAANLPRDALDLVLLDLSGDGVQDVQQELAMWETRVKPGGILAARGFGPEWPESLQAVLAHRHGNDMHMSVGGGLW
eukprot:CAMPEP_0204184048 /NCGR_PEP_ID=MMETSP0361-20130328/54134_1 /ASSEMBLY_ACC=CAM_ASM_000343 /TAXON_ID=268821 /ORGANISM="Scrippsiella Hangoei, Strain SHTV-5" /LENGTH=409 /DNA_ID=CAMNT_0051144043 /DNA_START=10 /DNA_END=1236 /DNA_ORIENTATION=-